jgi:hypothetical protein
MKLGPGHRAFDPVGIISVFNRHAVRYVVIGAFAAIAQQAPITPTRDIDFTPDPGLDNLVRLSDALQELNARIRTDAVDGGLPFDHDAQSLARSVVWNLICPCGEFDLSFRPSGFDGGYTQLSVRAHRVIVDNVEVTIADLDDVIRSKEAAGRPKDIRVLPTLYRYQASRRAEGKPKS